LIKIYRENLNALKNKNNTLEMISPRCAVAPRLRHSGLESRGLLFIVFSSLEHCPYLLKDGSMADKTSFNSPKLPPCCTMGLKSFRIYVNFLSLYNIIRFINLHCGPSILGQPRTHRKADLAGFRQFFSKNTQSVVFPALI
jgi:hypothetical protein